MGGGLALKTDTKKKRLLAVEKAIGSKVRRLPNGWRTLEAGRERLRRNGTGGGGGAARSSSARGGGVTQLHKRQKEVEISG